MSIEGPDKSQRIDNPEKAEAMAYESSDMHVSAIKNQREYEKAVEEGWSDTLISKSEGKAKLWKEKAEIAEEKAGIYFDINEQAKKLSEDEIEAEVKLANIRQRETHRLLREAKEAAANNPSELMIEEVNRADKEAIKASREYGAWQAAQMNRRIGQ